MDLRDDEEARLVVAVGRAFQRARIHTKILGYDHNWALHPNDGGPPDDPANPEYAASLLANPAAQPLPRRHRVPLLRRRPRPPVGPARRLPAEGHLLHRVLGLAVGRPGDDVPRHPALAHALPHRRRGAQLGQDRHHAGTSRSTPSGGPHNGGCGTCFGVVTIDPATGHATPTADYYVLGHVTRFIRPGAVRIDSTRRRQRLERRLPQPRRLDRPGRGQRRLGHDDTALQRRVRRAGVLLRAAGGRGGDLRPAAGRLALARRRSARRSRPRCILERSGVTSRQPSIGGQICPISRPTEGAAGRPPTRARRRAPGDPRGQARPAQGAQHGGSPDDAARQAESGIVQGGFFTTQSPPKR